MAAKRVIRVFFLIGLILSPAAAAPASNCSGLPTQFTGNEFPSGNFFSNFDNPCYYIPLPSGNGANGKGGDLNSLYWRIYYKVDPRYQLILVGDFHNARYFSITVYDEHSLIAQYILDANIVPLSSKFVNPYQPGVAYIGGQKYAVPVNFGGTPGALEKGCMVNGFNVDVNALDATQRHQGINWNTDPGVFIKLPGFPLHVVDNPAHTACNTAGMLMLRGYMDITAPQNAPHVIVRDVEYGCAYPAAYAIQTLQITTSNQSVGNTWLDSAQAAAHNEYATSYLAPFCYGPGATYPPDNNPPNPLSWARGPEYLPEANPNAAYINAVVPAGLPAALAVAGQVMRIRLRVPVTPPTPCTNGCSRSGNEALRYMSLSFQNPNWVTLASLADSEFVQDPHHYATLIVGTGAPIPSWVTAANGYTFLDLTALSGYQNLQSLVLRNLVPSPPFQCAGQIVPYNTTVYTPPPPGSTGSAGLMGDYLPFVDYPLAADLPRTAQPLVGPNQCGVFPAGRPAAAPNCGVVLPRGITVKPVPPQAPGASPVAVQPAPPITLNGNGFGLFPNGLPYTGDSNFLAVSNLTQNWTAGFTGSVCTVSVTNWAPSAIELNANVNQNAWCPLAAGDQLDISVWNPQTLTGPATATVTVAPN